jgi:hypothetical protein
MAEEKISTNESTPAFQTFKGSLFGICATRNQSTFNEKIKFGRGFGPPHIKVNGREMTYVSVHVYYDVHFC